MDEETEAKKDKVPPPSSRSQQVAKLGANPCLHLQLRLEAIHLHRHVNDNSFLTTLRLPSQAGSSKS